MSEQQLNRRYELRAYEATNPCRLARFLVELTTEPPQPIHRDDIIDIWSAAYPLHADMTGRRSVPSRLTAALTLLKAAGIARTVDEEPQYIEVTDEQLLRMAAGNLTIIEDARGASVRPSMWNERPQAPEHLQEMQAALELRRQQTSF